MEAKSSTAYGNSVAYFNGRVFTVNEKQTWATAFIVSETGIFEAVGSDKEILATVKLRKLVKFDLRQKFVMPGVHDAHSHMWMAGIQHLSEANVTLENNDARLAEKLKYYVTPCTLERWCKGYNQPKAGSPRAKQLSTTISLFTHWINFVTFLLVASRIS